MGLLGSFALQSYRQMSPASKPWNKCDYFYENKRIITIHSVFCSFLLSIFSVRTQPPNENCSSLSDIDIPHKKVYI